MLVRRLSRVFIKNHLQISDGIGRLFVCGPQSPVAFTGQHFITDLSGTLNQSLQTMSCC